ncbi:MAG: hypothetical protein ALECFALPRED_004716 [Alectoria fallacina]|uniref:Uncharacterized protein n=1 Tax=Alectoria fallacina TaxID=1903189 RepID=A0A8H3IRL3_9LECA|nr:MAG: hypothetical protein ALECFALPRED_004716 [Alectoria fallacina]
MATTRLASRVLSYGDPSSSQSSSGNLPSIEIAAIAIGTVHAVGRIYLLLFCPHFLFAWLEKSRSGHRPSESEEAPLEDLLPQRPARVSDDDGSNNGADDTEKRRRRPEAGRGGNTQSQGNHAIISGLPGSPVINNNNNIDISSIDYL